jgi:hypothetical protein
MWQKDTAPGTYTWQQALHYCVSIDLPGDNWRLPDFRELQSLMHKGYAEPYIDPVFHTAPGNYWTSASLVFERGAAIVVNFSDSGADAKMKTERLHVRAVRTMEPGEMEAAEYGLALPAPYLLEARLCLPIGTGLPARYTCTNRRLL